MTTGDVYGLILLAVITFVFVALFWWETRPVKPAPVKTPAQEEALQRALTARFSQMR